MQPYFDLAQLTAQFSCHVRGDGTFANLFEEFRGNFYG